MEEQLPKKTRAVCPNCTYPVALKSSGCVLHALVGVVRERGNTSERKLRRLHAEVNADYLWERLGPIIDDLEDGRLSER